MVPLASLVSILDPCGSRLLLYTDYYRLKYYESGLRELGLVDPTYHRPVLNTFDILNLWTPILVIECNTFIEARIFIRLLRSVGVPEYLL
jgi:hypothetical protein